ncbi:MAG TPA: hypothetical protein VJZ71_05345 [Phycisphaerae bacterium]|nr:hypothetical protein [Phycisphaerae bacterium]
MTSPAQSTEMDVTHDGAHLHGGRTLVLRIRFLCAMWVAAAIFWYVGRWVAGPVDPEGPISLISVDQGVIAMAELLGLAVVASGLAVAICGPGSAAHGALAIAIGLAALSMRGTQLDSLVLYRLSAEVGAGVSPDPFPRAALVAETWLWLALIAVGFVVGRWVESWFHADSGAIPRAHPVERAPDVRQGFGAVAVVSLIAWVLIAYTMGGEAIPLLKGQIFFSVGIAFMVGAMIASWLFRLNSQVWLLAAVALVATGAYLFAGPDAATLEAARQSGTYVTLRPIVRPLPIEYASMGAVGALLEQDAANFLRSLFGLPPVDGSEAED